MVYSILSYEWWGPTINLISKTHHLCARREYNINVHWKCCIITRLILAPKRATTFFELYWKVVFPKVFNGLFGLIKMK